MEIDVNVELIGLDKIKAKLDELENKASELRDAAAELNEAIWDIGLGIKQTRTTRNGESIKLGIDGEEVTKALFDKSNQERNAFAFAREKAGLTQKEVAEKLGVDQSSVSFWETGKTFPRAFILSRLSEIYCCPIDELLKDAGTKQEE